MKSSRFVCALMMQVDESWKRYTHSVKYERSIISITRTGLTHTLQRARQKHWHTHILLRCTHQYDATSSRLQYTHHWSVCVCMCVFSLFLFLITSPLHPFLSHSLTFLTIFFSHPFSFFILLHFFIIPYILFCYSSSLTFFSLICFMFLPLLCPFSSTISSLLLTFSYFLHHLLSLSSSPFPDLSAVYSK